MIKAILVIAGIIVVGFIYRFTKILREIIRAEKG